MAMKLKKGADLSGQRAINVGDPTTNTDAANKQYVDGVARGLDWKHEVIAASTGNVNLASPGSTLDGVTLAAGMQTVPEIGTVTRILLKDQTTATENGVYDWNGATSALTRSSDSATGTALSGSTYTVQRGTVNADRVYRVTADDPLTIGTTSVTFAQVGGAASPYTAGNGLTLSGQQFAVQPGNGIIADGTSTRVDPNVVARKYAADCVATTNPQTFSPGLGNDLIVQVYESGTQVFPDISTAAGVITVDWGSAPTAAQYRVVATG
jgi:hypothetical protein